MPIDPVTGTLIGAGIGAVGNLLGVGGSNRANRKQWERQTAYNHPVKQMQRLQEANLNPALIYGSGAQTATGQAASPPPQQPMPFGDIGSQIMDYSRFKLDSMNNSAQRGVLRSQEELNNEKTMTEMQKGKLTQEQFEQLNRAKDLNYQNIEARTKTAQYREDIEQLDWYLKTNMTDAEFKQLQDASFQSTISRLLLDKERLSSEQKLNGLRDIQNSLIKKNVDMYNANAFLRWLSVILGFVGKLPLMK